MFQPYPVTVARANGRAVDMICVAEAVVDGQPAPCLYDPETGTYEVADDGVFGRFDD